MKVRVIEWLGMNVGQVLDLPHDTCELLIEQGKAELVVDVINEKSGKNNTKRKTDGSNNSDGGEELAEG